MTSLAKYGQFRMDTAMSIDRLTKIMAVMRELGEASYAQISKETGIDRRAVARYVYHLCETNRLEVLVPHNLARRLPAVFSVVEDAEAIGSAVQRERPSAQAGFNRRLLGPNAWKRGEHAHRCDLLAALYPFPQG